MEDVCDRCGRTEDRKQLSTLILVRQDGTEFEMLICPNCIEFGGKQGEWFPLNTGGELVRVADRMFTGW